MKHYYYSVSGVAYLEYDTISHYTNVVRAETETNAEGIVYDMLEEKHPKRDGWTHSVVVAEIKINTGQDGSNSAR